jgi:protein FRA10AC1
VLSGAGENTCGNTRCEHHNNQDAPVHLSTLELPFAYEEHGERKSALVKVVLCPRCLKKLMWKRNKEKESLNATPSEGPLECSDRDDMAGEVDDTKRSHRSKERRDDKDKSIQGAALSTHRRSSRSRSPRHRRDNHGPRRRRSKSP